MLADGAEPMDATLFEPAEEAAHGDGKGRARVGVADIGGGAEEVDEANAAASPRSATIAGTTIALPVPVRWQSVPPPRFSARPWVPRDATVLGIRSGFSFNGELHIRKHAASIEVAARFVADGDRIHRLPVEILLLRPYVESDPSRPLTQFKRCGADATSAPRTERSCKARSVTPSRRAAFCKLPLFSEIAIRTAIPAVSRLMSLNVAPRAISDLTAPCRSLSWFVVGGLCRDRSSSGISPMLIGPRPTCRAEIRNIRCRSSRTLPS